MFSTPAVRRWAGITTLALVALATVAANARPVLPNPVPFAGMKWRNIGPLRAGRVAAVSGAVGEPGVFYIGLPEGGVWKTTNAGITWEPIFDSITSASSVGAVEVAPSDTSVIYVGMGDIITGGAIDEGDGVYKSTDAGRTWRHLGLDATKQIPSILVDPANADLVMVAAQGDVHHKSDSRGVFRSTDGGRTWTRTLFVSDEIGAVKLAAAHDTPAIVLAATDQHYVELGNPARGAFGGPSGTHLFKSDDEGLTWHELTGGGLPSLNGRVSVAVANHTSGRRMFLVDNAGLYRSDDGGASWRQMDASDTRIRNGQGGYNCGVYVDPANPDLVYVVNTSSYVSRDGGETFTGFKGAPGGDDPQQMWIDPANGQRILLGMDQGATVSLDGGRTWSPWYNQSTEQVYHISVDNSYPYWVYAPQQDAGAVRVRSRGNFGEITPLDWSPVGGWEWGSTVADPLNPNVVYASGSGILKITYPSEQVINVSPALDPGLRLRATSTNPLVWSPWNQHQLYAGFQYVMSTVDGGVHWAKLSPDLGYPRGVQPPPDTGAAGGRGGGGRGGAPGGGSIEAISPSTVARGLIWVSTNNGLIKVTRDDGKTWEDASISGLPDSTHADIEAVDASHHNPGEAYAAVDLHTVGDYQPYFYRTKDYGRTWTKIVTGLPSGEANGSFARVIRADTKVAGLLFAGTESSMYVSFDDGDHWESLRLNLPTVSFRDAVIKGNDLVVGTYGRGIWILDDISPLRQMMSNLANEPAHLFQPGEAIRVRRNVNQDTPYPPEVPHSLNPPDGALISYFLGRKPAGTITLDILDARGEPVRHFSSAPIELAPEYAKPPEPNFWLFVPQPMPTEIGGNRINWNLRYDDPPSFSHSFPISANPGLTPATPEGPLVLPGTYTAKLTVDGRSYSQPITVRNDPRSPASEADLRSQHALQMTIYDGITTAWGAMEDANRLRTALDGLANPPADVKAALEAFRARLDTVAGNAGGGRGRGGGLGGRGRGGAAPPNLTALNATLVRQLDGLDGGDMAPTAAMLAGWSGECRNLVTALSAWQRLIATDLPALNAVLTRAGIKPLDAPKRTLTAPQC
jgi:photosystem II stability/assembly factor-like uncharacterized protein